MAASTSSGFGDDDDGAMSDINVTPLVDVDARAADRVHDHGAGDRRLGADQGEPARDAAPWRWRTELPPMTIAVKRGRRRRLAHLRERTADRTKRG